ncbi:type II secretion system protein [Ferdinandcohnia quinoae]|uniref:Type II secretion system GspH family protein n=1 Tax=Fredinandcohnia quinoae TaxID=2918902 RepID=A0AAW5E003_9BACI|nr:type II secretion system protein [Fredinandcohnia sp. SECRCQ15]MCH1624914.1 type II secretion system GspH family protein [Fredinandcohnia sp. SECRCQ15]
MLLKCKKGFTLLEMLIALTIWLLLCTVFLPKLTVILIERKNIEIMNTGNKILSEELAQAFQDTWFEVGEEVIVKENYSYVLMRELNENIQKWEVCVSWTDKRNRIVERCGYAGK